MITLWYSCDKCGIVERAVQVPARDRSEPEGVVHWVQQVVGKCVGDDHLSVSPHCQADKITNLKIPVHEKADFIGQQVE